MITIVAHRGWSGEAPENTIAAFKLAMTDPDIPIIELDVHLSKDGIPVVIHDHVLDRTTSGTGPVKAFTLEELRQLDAGSWFAPSFEGERIPTLEEVLLLTKGSCKLHVELKSMGDEYEGIEEKVIAIIQRHNMQEEVFLSSFDHDSMKRANEIDPTIRTGLIFLGKPTLLIEQLRYTGAASVSIHYAFITPLFVEEMIQNGIDLGVWTVDDPDILTRIIEQYPDMRITTNHPDRVLRIVRGDRVTS
ncbi:glycerophosphodiester phosphodiesterase family protein [Paenibacillus sp. LHD-38]|uniref:glycerophosphodiester phosphodiesterase n=1 Tax=Paenibacillus sp. LHD-38 TaxID=3072143 RepID=UPI00280F4D2C|nr:glycerophosphodiester phosphodiesterase family protein [Paenibacillus sp. LHD-38]MDQ8735691.1 glycerophosphodiester phosphodiesterase family protein [Paenibacillus sp. LHD-38]